MKTVQLSLAAAALFAAFSVSAAPQPLGNPLRAAKGCQSLSAQETARCKKRKIIAPTSRKTRMYAF